MSGFRKHCLPTSLMSIVLPFVIGLARTGRAAQQRACEDQRWAEAFSAIRNVVRAVYPDLPPPTPIWTVTLDSTPFDTLPHPCGQFGLQIDGEAIPHDYQGHLTTSTMREGRRVPLAVTQGRLLSAGVELDCSGRIERATFSGSWANSAANENIRNLIKSHPSWTTAQAVHALEGTGATCGPKQQRACLRRVPLAALGKALGVSLAIETARFETFSSASGETNVYMEWQVKLEGDTADGRKVSYSVVLEPFGGRLVFLGLTR